MSNQFIRFKDSTIYLIKTTESVFVPFNSSIEKNLFLSQHVNGTFQMFDNYAQEYLYLVVDTEGYGSFLSKCAVTYNYAIDLIKRYL